MIVEYSLTRYEKAIAAGVTEEEAKAIFFTGVYKAISALVGLAAVAFGRAYNIHVVVAVVLCLVARTAFVPVFGPVTTANVESLLAKGDAQ